MWFDISFCDIEILFGSVNPIEIEISTEDNKNCPIRIYCIEFFSISKKDFNLKEKIKKLEKVIENS